MKVSGPLRRRRRDAPRYGKQPIKLAFCLIALIAMSAASVAQNGTGELVIYARDPQNLPIQCAVEIASSAAQVHEKSQTDLSGTYVRRGLPLGTYSVTVMHPGFAVSARAVQISSRVPVQLTLTLSISPENATVSVREVQTLVDSGETGPVAEVGPTGLQKGPVDRPGRSLIDTVAAQPGWVLESNGTLHPRGSEDQVQYVVNGTTLTDNRSPAFAAPIAAGDVESVRVLTAGIPAEYGKKLGGIVEITSSPEPDGLHGQIDFTGGTFNTAAADGEISYGAKRSVVFGGAHQDSTARYLDPPVVQNFTNHAFTRGASLGYQWDANTKDRFAFEIDHELADFQVPNEFVQQRAGQRQQRNNHETSATAGFEHVISDDAVIEVHLQARDVSASLTSNNLATPIIADQRRGFREWYGKSSISWHRGIQNVKAGGELEYCGLREGFSYEITAPSFFGAGTQPRLQYFGKGADREGALFLEDTIYAGRWSLAAGLRYDNYSLLVGNSGFSPRLGVGYYWPDLQLNLHASYDRIFQTPATENILLSSSTAVQQLSAQVLRLPVHPSTGNYWNVGVSKGLLKAMKLDVDYYRRALRNYADDDLLLNTGISFPISFASGRIYGIDTKLSLPHWKRLSGFVSYSYLVGFAYTPVTGGLFLGSDATNFLVFSRFPITQDQRNTISARGVVQMTKRLWTAFGSSYASGLPTEFSGTQAQALQQYGREIVNRVDFSRDRVRPSLALNASLGGDIVKRDAFTLRFQADAHNLNNRLNLINFSGLFSGTGIAPPRNFVARIQTVF